MINKAEFNTIQPTKMNSVQWKGGFWGSRFEQCEGLMIPNLEGALLDEDNSAFMKNFARAAGREEGMHIGTPWSDGDCYKWIQAAAHIYATTGNKELEAKMDQYIDDIATAQDDDGYINTYNQIGVSKKFNGNPDNYKRWHWYRGHEIYNLGHLYTVGAVHFKATGKRTLLDVAIKSANNLYDVFSPRPKELAHFGFNPTNIMGLVDLYRVTEDKKYLELANIFIEMRGTSEEHKDDLNQNRTPFKEETEAVGHAVLANYLYCGAVDVYSHTGDKEMKAAIDRVYDSAVNKKMYITGAQGAYYHGISSNLDPVEEAFAHEYELPSRTAYTETCANIANAMFNYRMLNVTGESKYADIMEQVMYNSGLSGANVEGTRFYYNNPLTRRDDGYVNRGGSNITDNSASERWLIHQCYCCPTSYVRTVAQVQEWAYGLDGNSVWVHLFGSSDFSADLNAGNLKISQKTNYPWDGTVEITIEEAPAEAVTLNIRNPRWSKKTTVTVDGNTNNISEPCYYPITKTFTKGEKIVIDMPMEVKFMRGNYLIEETKGMVAVMRGPVVYCVEGVDVKGDVSIDDLFLKRNEEYTPEYRADLLNGLQVLHTKAAYVKGQKDGSLYEELPEFADEDVEITMIPYYAWSNRDLCDMSVWLPLI